MEIYQQEFIYACLYAHQFQDFLVIMIQTCVFLNVFNLILEIKLVKDLAYHNVQLYLAFIIMPKISQEYVSKFVSLAHGVFNLQDNVLRILSYVVPNGLITQQTCALLLALQQVGFMEIRQQNSVFLCVLLIILLMIRLEHVFFNVLQIMELVEHLAIIQHVFVKKYAHNQTDLQILKQLTDTVFHNALKVPVNHLLILRLKLVSVNAQFFQVFWLKHKLLLVLQNV